MTFKTGRHTVRCSIALSAALVLGACGGDAGEQDAQQPSAPGIEGRPPTRVDLSGVWLQVQDQSQLGLLVQFRPNSVFAIDNRGEFGTSPAALGRYGLKDDAITFTSHGSDLCAEGDTWTWQAGLPEDGRLHVVHTDEAAEPCRVPLDREWALLRVTPRPHAALREITVPPAADGSPPTASDLHGIWFVVETPGLLVRLSPDGTFAIDNSGYVAPDQDASVLGKYELKGDTISLTIGGGHACPSGDPMAWKASLAEDGLMHIVHVDEASDNCRVGTGTEWTLIRLSPSSAVSADIASEVTAP